MQTVTIDTLKQFFIDAEQPDVAEKLQTNAEAVLKEKGVPVELISWFPFPDRLTAIRAYFPWEESPEGRDYWVEKAVMCATADNKDVEGPYKLVDLKQYYLDKGRSDVASAIQTAVESHGDDNVERCETQGYKSLATVLMKAFQWSDTELGHDFWQEAHDDLKRLEPDEDGDE